MNCKFCVIHQDHYAAYYIFLYSQGLCECLENSNEMTLAFVSVWSPLSQCIIFFHDVILMTKIVARSCVWSPSRSQTSVMCPAAAPAPADLQKEIERPLNFVCNDLQRQPKGWQNIWHIEAQKNGPHLAPLGIQWVNSNLVIPNQIRNKHQHGQE